MVFLIPFINRAAKETYRSEQETNRTVHEVGFFYFVILIINISLQEILIKRETRYYITFEIARISHHFNSDISVLLDIFYHILYQAFNCQWNFHYLLLRLTSVAAGTPILLHAKRTF